MKGPHPRLSRPETSRDSVPPGKHRDGCHQADEGRKRDRPIWLLLSTGITHISSLIAWFPLFQAQDHRTVARSMRMKQQKRQGRQHIKAHEQSRIRQDYHDDRRRHGAHGDRQKRCGHPKAAEADAPCYLQQSRGGSAQCESHHKEGLHQHCRSHSKHAESNDAACNVDKRNPG